jgi:acetylornithine deacetylase/succinyl-diaminopimelate desuccinylase-like protein
VVGFAEEEGQRYKATFLGSGALIGTSIPPGWTRRTPTASPCARRCATPACRNAGRDPALKRDPARYLGFVEVHIEQGPVLNELDLPLGIVTSINGGVRYLCEVIGMASHAGTTPMDRRRDAAAAVAELALFVEQRARDGDSVGTIGMLQVPNGSINVVPGRCLFSLDLRAPTDPQRDALVADVLAKLKASASAAACTTRRETMRAAAAPSAPAWQQRWERAVEALGVPLYRMPSGAGHDAMKLHEVMPQAMLFVRGQNSGISHNPLEAAPATTSSCACRPSAPAGPTRRLKNTDLQQEPHDYDKLDAWIDAHFDEEVRFLQELVRVPTDTPPGNNAPHAERTAELLKAFGFEAEKHPVPAADVKAYGLESITNLIVRRATATAAPSRSTPTATWCRPAKAGPTTPTAARSSTARSTAAPPPSASAISPASPSRCARSKRWARR